MLMFKASQRASGRRVGSRQPRTLLYGSRTLCGEGCLASPCNSLDFVKGEVR
jgi:hypothetical protein